MFQRKSQWHWFQQIQINKLQWCEYRWDASHAIACFFLASTCFYFISLLLFCVLVDWKIIGEFHHTYIYLYIKKKKNICTFNYKSIKSAFNQIAIVVSTKTSSCAWFLLPAIHKLRLFILWIQNNICSLKRVTKQINNCREAKQNQKQPKEYDHFEQTFTVVLSSLIFIH